MKPNHYHLQCRACGRIDDLEAEVNLDPRTIQDLGCGTGGIYVEVQALCRAWKEKNSLSEKEPKP